MSVLKAPKSCLAACGRLSIDYEIRLIDEDGEDGSRQARRKQRDRAARRRSRWRAMVQRAGAQRADRPKKKFARSLDPHPPTSAASMKIAISIWSTAPRTYRDREGLQRLSAWRVEDALAAKASRGVAKWSWSASPTTNGKRRWRPLLRGIRNGTLVAEGRADWLRAKTGVAGYKVPKSVRFIKAMVPKNPFGKPAAPRCTIPLLGRTRAQGS